MFGTIYTCVIIWWIYPCLTAQSTLFCILYFLYLCYAHDVFYRLDPKMGGDTSIIEFCPVVGSGPYATHSCSQTNLWNSQMGETLKTSGTSNAYLYSSHQFIMILIYILASNIFKFTLFADDTCLFSQNSELKSLESSTNNEFTKILIV